MTQYLPPNLLALFAPRDPIPFLPPPCKLPHEKKQKGYNGVSAFLNLFEHPSETPPPTRGETRDERIERKRRERAEQVAYKLEQEIAVWDPTCNPEATLDPFKTLFVARINYDTAESKLRREFEGYGPIKKIVVVHNSIDGKPRGYAFIEYEHERDMHSAYKHADGKKIDGKRVLVDVERARTVKGWLPRRLGGGLGGTRRGGSDVNIKHSGREDNERERERYRLEREREEQRGNRDRGSGGGLASEERGAAARRRSRSPRRRSVERGNVDRGVRRDRDRGDKDRDRGDRDKDKERRRKRSRSRSRGRRGSSRGRDRSRDRRDKKRSRRDKDKEPKPDVNNIKIKEEPADDYPDFSIDTNVQVKQEAPDNYEDEEKYNPEQESNGNDYYNY